MPQRLVSKKFGQISLFKEYIIQEKLDLQKKKNEQTISRLFHFPKCSRRKDDCQKHFNSNDFRHNWLCIDCKKVFALKPIKKYKTVQQFKIRCNICRSNNVTHNDTLSKMIKQGNILYYLSAFELPIDWEINLAFSRRSNYYVTVLNY